MKLSQLAREAGDLVLELTGECDIQSLSADSREETQQSLFFCIKGAHYDAHVFAGQAIQNGAKALVVTKYQPQYQVPQVVVSDDRIAMALMARAFFGFADTRMKLIGITGTKGKTTTSYLVKAILEQTGHLTGLIGTTGNMIGNQWMNSSLTTPDPIEMHKTLRQMADAGCAFVVMEVSAHALVMHRLHGMVFEAGCFTNLSQDHLDFFGNMDAYYQVKRNFFLSGQVRNAVVNLDDSWVFSMREQLQIPTISYAICINADLFARDIQIEESGVSFRLSLWNDKYYDVNLQLMGMFNIYNALAAAGIGLVAGAEPEDICQALASVSSVPGRAEVLDTQTPYKVILDYSHSPDALDNILRAIREFSRGRLIVVFGCGGDRDHGKRPVMGEIAGRMADLSILTSDNPRAENPLEILSAIEAGIKPTGARYEVIENRREAIRKALMTAGEGDVVLLAGKGHETYQEISGLKKPFNEKTIVAELLNELSQGNANA